MTPMRHEAVNRVQAAAEALMAHSDRVAYDLENSSEQGDRDLTVLALVQAALDRPSHLEEPGWLSVTAWVANAGDLRHIEKRLPQHGVQIWLRMWIRMVEARAWSRSIGLVP